MLNVDNKGVFTIVTHKSILVEKTIKNLKFPESVPVYRDMNYEELAGIAVLRKAKGRLFADLYLLVDMLGYPAIAYIQKEDANFVYAVGICRARNADKDILAIGK